MSRLHPRVLGVLLTLSLGGLVLSARLPHEHRDGTPSDHPVQACQLCKTQQQLAADMPSAPPALLSALVCVERSMGAWLNAPRPAARHSHSSRAPPAVSSV
jgi:hypothetical protein